MNLNKWLIAVLSALVLLSSCGSPQKENKDALVEQLMDSPNVYKERQDGERMILWLDSLMTMEIEMRNIALLYAEAYINSLQ